MCLLVLFHRHIPGYPLVLAANRDEIYARPAAPPKVWDRGAGGGRSFLAPVDEQAGGTWIGLNDRGAIAAVTNRKQVPFEKDAPSRGLLCADALSRGSVADMARSCLDRAGGRSHNGFNLMVADSEEALVLAGDGHKVDGTALPPGVHVLTNEHDLNALSLDSQEVLQQAPETPDRLTARLIALLGRHNPISADGFAPCKHHGDRGTRSATVIAVDEAGGAVYRFADGPPCNTPFADLSCEAGRLLH